MTPEVPFLEGTFWDKFWRPLRSRRFCLIPTFDLLEFSGVLGGPLGGQGQHNAKVYLHQGKKPSITLLYTQPLVLIGVELTGPNPCMYIYTQQASK